MAKQTWKNSCCLTWVQLLQRKSGLRCRRVLSNDSSGLLTEEGKDALSLVFSKRCLARWLVCCIITLHMATKKSGWQMM